MITSQYAHLYTTSRLPSGVDLSAVEEVVWSLNSGAPHQGGSSNAHKHMTWPGSLRSTCHSPSQHCFHAGSLKALQHTFQKLNTILSPCTLSCLCCLSSLLHLRIHQGLSIRSLFLP